MKLQYNEQTGNEQKSSKGFGYYPQKLGVAEAITWFLLTAFALFISGTAKSDTPLGAVNKQNSSVTQTITGSNSCDQLNASITVQSVK